jgi:cyclic pyranopterin phosphate synthase
MPESGVYKINHQEILSYEEIIQLVRAMAAEGVTKIRLTGGEPLVRKNIVGFVRDLAAVPGIDDLRLTTNGVLLGELAEPLHRAGIGRVNISIDSLDRENFRQITGRDELPKVLEGILAALAAGFERVKLNVVAIRGLNHHQVPALAGLIFEHDLDVRFIEFMPLGQTSFWSDDKFISTKEIKELIKPLGELRTAPRSPADGPAQVFTVDGAKGRLGFISPLTEHFCGTCNRLRLTADGKLRLCLLSDLEVDLKQALRSPATQAELQEIIRAAAARKPAAHCLKKDIHSANGRSMNLIGG